MATALQRQPPPKPSASGIDAIRVRAALAVTMMIALFATGCATSQPTVDPIFRAVPGQRVNCATPPDNRNVVMRGATSMPGQAIIGGLAGGVIGNQFGSGSGRDIATGAGAAAGATAGAYNANRMQDQRAIECQQRQYRHSNDAY